MSIERLSALKVQRERKPGYYCDGGGLYLQVSPAQTKSWIFRFKLNGKAREMGLGAVHSVSLARARELAKECRQLVAAGRDPIEERELARRARGLSHALDFAGCAEAYIAAHEPGWSNRKHANQWRSTLRTYAFPILGTSAPSNIDTAAVLKVLQPIWYTKPETASRVRGRIESVLDWAKVQGLRAGENPARWRGHLDKLLPSRNKVKPTKHHPALPYDELPAFMSQLAKRRGISARALEFAILCASRSIEVRGARHAEFDLKRRIWTIPAERMKGRREHRVPLTDPAIRLLKRLPKRNDSEYVFAAPEGGMLSDMAMMEVLRQMGRGDITQHGFRSTFRDWAGETTPYPREVIEHAIAHKLKDKSEAAYQRGDMFAKRVKLMDQWAGYCTTLAQRPREDNLFSRARQVRSSGSALARTHPARPQPRHAR